MDIDKYIHFIEEELIGKGLAYVINTEVGYFVCVNKYPLSIKPVDYAILKDLTRSSTDYPIWAPYTEGHLSPWGNGQFTVNMHLLLQEWSIHPIIETI
jgi:hypothetical protein